jgi:hypothetical protein
VASADERTTELRGRIAQLYIGWARRKLDEGTSQALSDAATIIANGARLTSNAAAFADLTTTLEGLKQKFKGEQVRTDLLNRIASLERKIEVATKKDTLPGIAEAQNRLKELSKLFADNSAALEAAELEKHEEFRSATVPRWLAESYGRQADDLLNQERFAEAIALIDRGLVAVPDFPSLVAARDIAVKAQEEKGQQPSPPPPPDDSERRLAAVSDWLADANRALDVNALTRELSELEAKVPDLFASRREEMKNVVVASIVDLYKRDAAKATVREMTARAIFPDLPKRPPPDSCAVPAKAGKGAGADGGRYRCADSLGSGNGPTLVVVTPSANGKRYAISRYEITVAEFNEYCRSSGKCTPNGAEGSLPVTNVSAQDVLAYLDWLTSATGFRYRLPSGEEWEHAAEAAAGGGSENVNCHIVLGDVEKGVKLLDVNSGTQNGFGLMNALGNAQEFVTIGPGQFQARGGAYSDSLKDCTIKMARPHSGAPDSITGFRVVREIKDAG